MLVAGIDSILRTHRFFNDGELVMFFKAHVLSFIEYRTPGVYHAAPSALQRLDSVLSKFLRSLSKLLGLLLLWLLLLVLVLL